MSAAKRRLLIPEVIQTSAMDCGPAALKAMLEGFDVSVSYGRLREACRTDVDGTSVDTIEELAKSLGADASQVLVPLDHFLLAETNVMPCIAVVTVAATGNHFVTVWRKHGPWLQIMDPASGRRWVRQSEFLETLYKHEQELPAEAWYGWAGGEGYRKQLAARMKMAGVESIEAKIDAALADGQWRSLAALDAAVRLAAALRSPSLISLVSQPELIPDDYWSVVPGEEPEAVKVRGAVAISVSGVGPADMATLPESLRNVLAEKPVRLETELWNTVRQDGLGVPLLAALAVTLGAGGVLGETLLFRSLLGLSHYLQSIDQRILGVVILFLLLGAITAFEWAGETLLRRIGRRLELRLRLRFAAKLPRLGDRYFQSRLISDMAQRAHSMQILRNAAVLFGSVLRGGTAMVATLVGIGLVYPDAIWPALACAGLSVLAPFLAQSQLNERDLRAREYGGALSRFYLDALLGIVPVRAHGAGPALQTSQHSQLAHWAGARLSLARATVQVTGVQMMLGYGAAAWTILQAMRTADNPAALILLVYWALSLPQVGQSVALAAYQWPSLRNSLLRILEPLGSPEMAAGASEHTTARRSGPVAIQLREVDVVAGGHPILRGISVDIAAGEHVGIVGTSGAGKSSLVGLLLGWYSPAVGEILLDGEPMTEEALLTLRRQTAWVDPQVQIWNTTLYDNLRYGLEANHPLDAGRAIQESNLATVIEKLPGGLQAKLGEGGALVSGGEGQRVRMARAFGKGNVRLAILDEPARGLDRHMRREFAERARAAWKDATLLCITHDVASTKAFPRVLVVHAGEIVEDGSPDDLYNRPDSRYRALCDREDAVRERLWNGAHWRRFSLSGGRL